MQKEQEQWFCHAGWNMAKQENEGQGAYGMAHRAACSIGTRKGKRLRSLGEGGQEEEERRSRRQPGAEAEKL